MKCWRRSGRRCVGRYKRSAAVIGVAAVIVYLAQQQIIVRNRNGSLIEQQESAVAVKTNAIELSKEIAAFATEYDQKETQITLQYKTLPLEWKRIAAEEAKTYQTASEEYSRRFDGRIGQAVEQLRNLGITLPRDPIDYFSPVHPDAWRATAVALDTAANRIPSSDKSKTIDWLTSVLEWYGAIFLIWYVSLFAGLTWRDVWSLFGALK